MGSGKSYLIKRRELASIPEIFYWQGTMSCSCYVDNNEGMFWTIISKMLYKFPHILQNDSGWRKIRPQFVDSLASLCTADLKYRRDQFVWSVLEPRETRSGDREAPADWNVTRGLTWAALVSCQNTHLFYPGTLSSPHNVTVSFINYFGRKNKIFRTVHRSYIIYVSCN